jgi:hypothetical protein
MRYLIGTNIVVFSMIESDANRGSFSMKNSKRKMVSLQSEISRMNI